jgi:hypothetical protein
MEANKIEVSPKLALLKKIAKVKFDLGKINKTLINPFYNSHYFDINLLIEHVEESLTLNDLLLLQPIIDGYVVSQIIDLETGEVNESSLKLPELNDPQKIGSCITFYRRYALQSQLGIQAEDDDGNKASGKTSPGNKSDQPKKDWLNPGTPKWKDAVQFLKGDGTIDKIKKKYNISKENETKLITEVNQAA